MADTTESKTYLVDVKSNLAKYAEDAAKAKVKVDELTVSTTALKKAGLDNTDEYQKQIAQLKIAKDEYSSLQKVVQAGLQLTNKELSYRQQLTAAIKVSIQNIKDLGSGYIKNAQGVEVLNPKLIREREILEGLNKELQTHDKSLSSGSTSVGLYGQAIEGAFKDVGSKIMSMVGPMALVGAAITLGTKLWQGFKEAITSTTFAIDLMNKSAAISKQLFFDLAINGKVTLENLVTASKLQGELNVLRIKDAAEVLQISKLNREQQEIREISIDKTKTDAERLAALIKVRELESQKTKIQIGNLTDELKVKEDLWKIQPTEKIMLRILELRAKIEDTYAAEEVAMRRVTSQLTGFEQEKIDARKKGYDAWMAEIDATNKAEEDATKKRINEAARVKAEAEKAMADSKKVLTKEIDDYKKFISDKQKEDAKDKEKKKKDYLDHQEWERNQFLSNQENLIAMKEANNEWLYSIERQRLEIQRRDEIVNAEKTGANINIIEAKYSALREQINRAEADAKLGLYADFAGNLAIIFGKNTAIGKAAAIAETTINTYRSATAAYAALAGVPVVGPVLGIAAAAAAVAAGIANVKKILAVKIPGGDSGGTVPTAISSSQPAQRTFAQAQGSSVLTQAQLSQPQLNAIPNQNMLTAADIANALKGMPAPIVTVEDINAKVKSVAKVAVRANI